MAFLTTQPDAPPVSVSGPRRGRPARGSAASSTCANRRIPAAGERRAHPATQFMGYAEILDSMRTQAPAVLRQLADVLTHSTPTQAADSDAHR